MAPAFLLIALPLALNAPLRWPAAAYSPLRASGAARTSLSPRLNAGGKGGAKSLSGFLFGPLAKKAEQAEQAENLWKVTTRAFTARGKADLDALRAVSTLLGVGDDFDRLQRSFGVDASNATDPSAEMLANMGEVVKAGLTSSLESRAERRQCLAFSVVLGALCVEAVQMLLVLPIAWLLGAGLSAAPGGQAPLGAALTVALRSRHLTRPLRLVTQVWATRKVRRQLAVVPPRRRAESAARCLAILVAVVGLATLALTQADMALFDYVSRSKFVAASSALGKNALSAACFEPPLVILTRGVRPDLAESAASLCALLRGCARDLCSLFSLLAEQMRLVKPLNALLDLAETDQWLVDTAQHLRALVMG